MRFILVIAAIIFLNLCASSQDLNMVFYEGDTAYLVVKDKIGGELGKSPLDHPVRIERNSVTNSFSLLLGYGINLAKQILYHRYEFSFVEKNGEVYKVKDENNHILYFIDKMDSENVAMLYDENYPNSATYRYFSNLRRVPH